jgi:hypothetical protein
VPDAELVPFGISQHGPVVRVKVLPPQDAGTQLHEAIDRRTLIGHLHIHVRPVLTDLGLGYLLQEEPRFGICGITQDGIAALAMIQLVAQSCRPEIDHGSEIVPVQADLADVVQRHPVSVQVGFGYQNGQLGMIRNIRE